MSQTAPQGPQRMLAGRYSIDELLGQGGMSTVYRGTDVKLGRQVAIKIMRANLADDEQFRSRFRQEAQSASRLAHPSVVRVLDAGDDLIQSAAGPQRLPFIVMEFVDGKNLRELVAEQQLTIAETCRVVDSVLTALEYSHRAGLVHRDIKPANIMITKSGQVKVMDFGIARIIDSLRTKTGMVLGTPSYMSPEQLLGKKVDGRTDLYSLGVMLYQMTCGQLPFVGQSMGQLMVRIANEACPDVRTVNPLAPEALAAVVERATRKEAAQRFQTGDEMARALRACLAEAPDSEIAQ